MYYVPNSSPQTVNIELSTFVNHLSKTHPGVLPGGHYSLALSTGNEPNF